jgi:16S rRNA (adenine1518-N6/adenine1519-N6)-dimethyltransferase
MKKRSESFPKKRLGQHFLKDYHVIHRIIDRAGFQKTDRVIEVGPGKGALTIPLAKTVDRVIAVEKDKALVLALAKKISGAKITNISLIHQDILHWNFHEGFPSEESKILIIGNLPYNITSPFLGKLLRNRSLIRRAVLMLQFEVAQRLIAPAGSKIYGALSLLVQYDAHTKPLLHVPSRAFYPVPKVDSMVVELDFEKPYPNRAQHDMHFKKVVKAAFAHRRKTLLNSFNMSFPEWNRARISELITSCGIDPQSRAEALDMDAFLSLSNVLPLTKEKQDDK